MGGEENTHLKAMLQNQNQKILQNQNQQKILQNQVRDLQAQVSVLIGELTDSKSKERFKVLRGNWRGQNPESESEPAMMECNQTEEDSEVQNQKIQKETTQLTRNSGVNLHSLNFASIDCDCDGDSIYGAESDSEGSQNSEESNQNQKPENSNSENQTQFDDQATEYSEETVASGASESVLAEQKHFDDSDSAGSRDSKTQDQCEKPQNKRHKRYHHWSDTEKMMLYKYGMESRQERLKYTRLLGMSDDVSDRFMSTMRNSKEGPEGCLGDRRHTAQIEHPNGQKITPELENLILEWVYSFPKMTYKTVRKMLNTKILLDLARSMRRTDLAAEGISLDLEKFDPKKIVGYLKERKIDVPIKKAKTKPESGPGPEEKSTEFSSESDSGPNDEEVLRVGTLLAYLKAKLSAESLSEIKSIYKKKEIKSDETIRRCYNRLNLTFKEVVHERSTANTAAAKARRLELPKEHFEKLTSDDYEVFYQDEMPFYVGEMLSRHKGYSLKGTRACAMATPGSKQSFRTQVSMYTHTKFGVVTMELFPPRKELHQTKAGNMVDSYVQSYGKQEFIQSFNQFLEDIMKTDRIRERVKGKTIILFVDNAAEHGKRGEEDTLIAKCPKGEEFQEFKKEHGIKFQVVRLPPNSPQLNLTEYYNRTLRTKVNTLRSTAEMNIKLLQKQQHGYVTQHRIDTLLKILKQCRSEMIGKVQSSSRRMLELKLLRVIDQDGYLDFHLPM
mmetsp:Transcript_2877/g.5464  ORF Transcript_2877/g.5464 Transcript_2877/m.5464 type:complete len:729 (+) Transcript_2877:2065-4251(+)